MNVANLYLLNSRGFNNGRQWNRIFLTPRRTSMAEIIERVSGNWTENLLPKPGLESIVTCPPNI